MPSTKPLTVLLIEDNPGDQRLVEEMLKDWGSRRYRLLIAAQVAAAVPLLEAEAIDLILLDLELPDGSGLDTLLKVRSLTPGIPIVVLSQAEDEAMALGAVRLGAQDFLVKSHINGTLLCRSLSYAMERRRLEEELHHLAHHDPLTGLPNRKMFYERLRHALAAARRHQRPLALMLVDLNRFKWINDAHGHQAGDHVLRDVASRLESAIRSTDCVARLGGDEFVLFVSDMGDAQHTTQVANKLRMRLDAPSEFDGRSLPCRGSIGVAVFPHDGEDIETLVRHADAAMYDAKAASREISVCRFYSSQLDSVSTAHAAMADALRDAFERGQFVVNYQPQIELHSGRMTGVEALLRWNRTDGELTLPSAFIPALEASGLIVEVGAWVLDTACRQAALWHAGSAAGIKVAVNVSPMQFREAAFVDRVAAALKTSGLPPEQLELELGEDVLREDEAFALDVLGRLNRLGVRLALANYRNDAISLRDLGRFPIHAVKLDGAIVREMTQSPEDSAIVQAVISIAHIYRMKGVAEGVETADQVKLLRQHSCDDAQGYMFAKPLSAAACTELLRPTRGLPLQ